MNSGVRSCSVRGVLCRISSAPSLAAPPGDGDEGERVTLIRQPEMRPRVPAPPSLVQRPVKVRDEAAHVPRRVLFPRLSLPPRARPTRGRADPRASLRNLASLSEYVCPWSDTRARRRHETHPHRRGRVRPPIPPPATAATNAVDEEWWRTPPPPARRRVGRLARRRRRLRVDDRRRKSYPWGRRSRRFCFRRGDRTRRRNDRPESKGTTPSSSSEQ